MKRGGRARVSRRPPFLLLLVGLAAAIGCRTTDPCNQGTVLATIDFDSATRAADVLDVEVSIDGGPAKTSSIAHKPGDAQSSVEIYFPNNGGYPVGRRLDVTIVARSGQNVLGMQAAGIVALPSGCATLAIRFGSRSDGGNADSGGGAGGGGTGGSGGSMGGSGGVPACTGGTGQSFTPLPLQNGWTAYGNGAAAPAVGLDCSGVVQFKGAIAAPTGSNPAAFTLPASLRPPTTIWVPVDMALATKGRLVIDPSSGVVTLEAETAASNATGFTSLEGASYALSATGYAPLTLQNGWAPYDGARTPAVASSGGIVRFQGAVAGGTLGQPIFTLPAAMSPPASVFVSVDMALAKKGRLNIQSSGAVLAEAASTGSPTDASGFTSLEGAWFALTPAGYTALGLQNGWAIYGGSRAPAVSVSGGVVRFQGAMGSGTVAQPFVMPTGFRPAAEVLVPVGLCDAAHGRLHILPTGEVTIEPEIALSDATCLTTLEGVFFGL